MKRFNPMDGRETYRALTGSAHQTEMSSTHQTASNDLDLILSQLGEKIGKYQFKNYIFIFIPVVVSAIYTLTYVFTARNLEYRCLVPECDSQPVPEFNPTWIRNAVPSPRNNTPSRCQRFVPVIVTHFNVLNVNDSNNCPSTLFNQTVTQKCDKFVYNTDEVTIVNDFNVMCEENLWKLALVGTINNIGQFVCLPIAGYVSDRFGRRFLMLGGLILSSLMGIIRSFAVNYQMFLAFEFLDTAVGSGAYSSGFILGVELVSPDKRVLTGTLISSCYTVGEALIGIVAWATNSWRHLLRYLYFPGFILIFFFWLTPESLKWLLAKGRYEEVKTIIRNAAKMNNMQISEDMLQRLDYHSEKEKEETQKYPMRDVLRSRKLLLRLVNCSLSWITCGFVFYGLSLNSVAIAGNLYWNFVSVALIEIPGYFCTYLILDRLGRRFSLCGSLLLSGSACLAFLFLPKDTSWLHLAVFLVGKFGITISFTVVYVFTTELFPTSLRHSLLGTCSMFGRIGSMVAPQTPLLAEIMESLPLIMFGAMSVTAGSFVLLLPETLNTKLPDTVEEAENIGQKEKLDTPI